MHLSAKLWKIPHRVDLGSPAKLAIVTLLYLGCCGVSFWLLNLDSRPSPIWLGAGVGLTAIVFWSEAMVWGIFAGDLLFSISGGATWWVALASALGSALAALAGGRLLHYCGFSPRLERTRDAIALIFLAAVLASTINATIDAHARFWLQPWNWRAFGQSWGTIWLGDTLGILIVTPLVLRWRFSRRPWRMPARKVIEAICCLGLLLAVGWVVLGCQEGILNDRSEQWSFAQYLEYLPFPFVVWAAIRFRIRGTIAANFSLAFLALLGMSRDVGPFVLQTPDATRAVLVLQMYLTIVMSTSLLLATSIAERENLDLALTRTLEREQLLTNLAFKVHSSLDLSEVLQTSVEEIRSFLRAEQVYIGYCNDKDGTKILAESRLDSIPSLLDWTPEPNLLGELGKLFSISNLIIADNKERVATLPNLKSYYNYLKVKSSLVLPLAVNNQHLGALVVHEYSSFRSWQKDEVDLLTRLATQLSIALGQARLYRTVQDLNNNLERQVEERTSQLKEKVAEIQNLYEMKTVFLQAVSHDLRTSIMGLIMLLKNLQQRSGDCVNISRPILDRVIQSTDRQLTLINALSRDHFEEPCPLVLHRDSFNLKTLILSWSAGWRSDLDRAGAILTDLVPDDLPPVYVDSSQLKRVFDHLIRNAIVHNPPNLELVLSARLDRERIYCTLTDNGIGMNEKQCQDLFGLFVRNIHNQHLTGIGLGCYQCRQIIEAHGGEIGVRSSPNRGSSFWFTMPVDVKPDDKILTPDVLHTDDRPV